jgi:protein tyrosine phosphatase
MSNNFIENVSRANIEEAFHSEAGENAMLIQICDFFDSPPKPLRDFKIVMQFAFDDVEDEGATSISDRDAELIIDSLRYARDHNMNVIVHCHAGLCRSGAVVEAGIHLGFNEPDRRRIPNGLVKQKLFKVMGVHINRETSMFNDFQYP